MMLQEIFKNHIKHSVSWGFIMAILSPQALADTLQAKGLHHSPGGDDLIYLDPQKSSFTEASVEHQSFGGQASSEKERFTGYTDSHKLSIHAGRSINPILLFHGYASRQMAESSYSTRWGHRAFSYSAQTVRTEFGAGPSLRVKKLVFGGEVGVVQESEEQQEITTQTREIQARIPSGRIPFVRVHTGYTDQKKSFVAGAKLVGGADLDRIVTTNFQERYQKTIHKSDPQQLWIVGLFTPTPRLKFAGELTYNQIKAKIDRLEESDARLMTQSPMKEQDFVNLAFGGSYQASDDVELNSTLSYLTPRYETTEDASLIHQNLGGPKIVVGGKLNINLGNIGFNAGYTLPQKLRYTVKDQAATPWAEAGENITMQQDVWVYRFSIDLVI